MKGLKKLSQTVPPGSPTSTSTPAPSPSAGEDREELADKLIKAFEALKVGISIGAKKDFSKTNNSPIIGRYIDSLANLFSGRLPGSRHLETKIKTQVGFELDSEKINEIAKKTLSEKILRPAKRLYINNFNYYVNTVEKSSVLDSISKSALSGDSEYRARQLASEFLALDITSSSDGVPALSSSSPYKMILNDVIDSFREKFSAISTYSVADGIDIAERIRSSSETPGDIEFLKNLFSAIIEWGAYIDGFSSSWSSSYSSAPSSSPSHSRACAETVDDLMQRVEFIAIEPSLGMSSGPRPGEISLNRGTTTISGKLKIIVKPSSSYGSDESISLINSCHDNFEYIEWMEAEGIIDLSGHAGSASPPSIDDIIDGDSVSTSLISMSGEPALVFTVRLRDPFLSTLSAGDVIFDFSAAALPTITIRGEDQSSLDLRKISSDVTTPMYETVSPSGETVVFTPSDLVANNGRVRSKGGKYFKPKKIKGRSLSERVNSPSYGRVKGKGGKK